MLEFLFDAAGISLALFFASIALSCADIDWPWTRESWNPKSYEWMPMKWPKLPDWPWKRDD